MTPSGDQLAGDDAASVQSALRSGWVTADCNHHHHHHHLGVGSSARSSGRSFMGQANNELRELMRQNLYVLDDILRTDPGLNGADSVRRSAYTGSMNSRASSLMRKKVGVYLPRWKTNSSRIRK